MSRSAHQVIAMVLRVLLIAVAPVWADDWREISESAPYRSFTPRDGLSQSEARHIAQDEAGYLWVATARGLSRFDGREFRTYSIGDGLPRNTLNVVQPGQSGVWIGDDRGNLSVLRDEHVRVVRLADPDARSAVVAITEHAGMAFVATEEHGLLRIDASTLGQPPLPEEVIYPPGQPIHDLAVNADTLWFVAGETLYRQDLTQPGPPQALREGVAASTFDQHGVHWLLGTDRQAGVYRDGSVETRGRFDGESALTDLVIGKDGTIWARSERAIHGIHLQRSSRRSGNGASKHSSEFGKIHDLFVDREGVLWIGSEARLTQFYGERFAHYALDDVGYNAVVWSVMRHSSGDVFIGTDGELLQLSGDRVRGLNEQLGIPLGGSVDGLVEVDETTLLVAVYKHGLYEVDLATYTARLLADTQDKRIGGIYFDRKGRLWVLAKDGLYVRHPGEDQLTTVQATESKTIYSLDVGDDGSVWYSVNEFGLVHLSPDLSVRTEYGPEHGFAAVRYNHIRLVRDDLLWVAGDDGSLYRFDGTFAENFAPSTPLKSDSVYTVEVLPDGTVVAGGSQGLVHLNADTREIYQYGERHGFQGLESNANATFLDEQGYLWIGTIAGLSRMDVRRAAPKLQAPTPQILSIRPMGDGHWAQDGLIMGWDAEGVSVRYAAQSLLFPQSVEYSYRLSGLTEEWSPPTRNSTVDFSRLEPGTYRFSVRSRLNDQPWSTPATSPSITVLTPYWRTPWFIALTILTIAAMVPLGIRIRTQHMAAVNLRLRQEVLERTRGIEEAKGELEASHEQLRQEVEERRKADEARLEVEERFRRAFESSPNGMALITAQREVIDANEALVLMLNPQRSLEGSTLGLFEAIAPEDTHRFDHLLSGLETDIKEREQVEFRLINANGDELDVVVSLSAIRFKNTGYRYCVCQLQDVTEARRLNEQLTYQANYDDLTGLLNRRAFDARLRQAYAHLRSDTDAYEAFLLHMDLDQFKVVNDTSGHTAGDELLKRLSTLIRDEVPASDLVGRLGGDEFALLLTNCPESVALRIAESIRSAVEDLQFTWDTETYRVGASIGMVPFDRRVGDVSELEQLADAACYEAKDRGRNCVQYTKSADLDEGDSPRSEVRWVQRIRDGLQHDRFTLYGQRIDGVNDENGPERMEILLRLRDVEGRRLIPPGAFLPAAERYGLVTQIDEWVVRNLIRTLYVHEASGGAPRRYWINLSGNSVGDRRFADFLVQAIKHSPLPPGTLNFEITETAVIRSIADAGKLMGKLRDLGCEFALDDFGSGLSSFGYLKKLPVEYLKIDGMFVREILTDHTDRMFVRSIIDIAHTLGIKVTTEFVENDEVRAVVADLGADYVQGYGIHKPEPLSPNFSDLTGMTAGIASAMQQRR